MYGRMYHQMSLSKGGVYHIPVAKLKIQKRLLHVRIADRGHIFRSDSHKSISHDIEPRLVHGRDQLSYESF